jgi:chorismate mutase/prephenate dehydratase
MADPPDELARLRQDLDRVDDQIVELLNERAQLVKRVGALKKERGGPFYVAEREREILNRLTASSSGPFPEAGLRVVMQEVISACLSLEQGQRIAYLGPTGTFTHLAVIQRFGSSAQAAPCGTIRAVFEEVERGSTQFGVVPVENSSQGSVIHTLDSFVTTEIRIVGEILVPVEHALLAAVGVNEGAIDRVYSHPQALAQCAQWLGTNLKRAALVETSSTADAARAARSDHAGAAIASEPAAREHGLIVLRRAIQDASDNVTRFLVLGPKDSASPPSGNDTTSILLALPHRAGALFEVLQPLSLAQINISKIESRPYPAEAWQYVFFLDLDGHASDEPLRTVLETLRAKCPLFRVLGAYPRATPNGSPSSR